jgi:hypothetical protein
VYKGRGLKTRIYRSPAPSRSATFLENHLNEYTPHKNDHRYYDKNRSDGYSDYRHHSSRSTRDRHYLNHGNDGHYNHHHHHHHHHHSHGSSDGHHNNRHSLSLDHAHNLHSGNLKPSEGGVVEEIKENPEVKD